MISKKIMKSIGFLLAMFTTADASFFSNTSLSPKASRAQQTLEGIEYLIDQALVDFQVPGLAIGVVVDGQVILAKGFGFRDVTSKSPINANTVFPIGSCTKAFTTFSMGKLIEEGFFKWDDRVIDHLPEFRLQDQYATHNLTLRDLVTHRSGVSRHDFMWYNTNPTRQQLLKRLRFLEPSCEPRTRANYTNIMYLVAGLAMEKAVEKSWETLVTEKILTPLEMHSTSFTIEQMQKGNNFAYPHLERNEVLKKIPFRSVTCIGPAASINSNVNDMTKWIQMLLSQGNYKDRPLISSASLQEMYTPQVILSGYPESQDSLLGSYGLGWIIHSYRGHYFVSHDGGVDGFTSVVSILPHDGVGIVVLVNKNLSNVARFVSLEVLDRVLELPSRNWLKEGLAQIQKSKHVVIENKQLEDVQRKKGTSPTHATNDYVGEYEHPGYGILRIEKKDGKLHSIFNGIRSVLEHWHYDIFSVIEEDQDLIIPREGMKYSFRNHLNGDIEEVMVPFESNAPDIIFKKVPESQLSNFSYFNQFTGSYDIYNVTIEILIRDNALIAQIPGQPSYELVPVSENEFTVKTMSHYTVRFVKNNVDEVLEALLVLPYGAYSAKKKRK